MGTVAENFTKSSAFSRFTIAHDYPVAEPSWTAPGLRWSPGFSRFWRIQGARRLKAVLQRVCDEFRTQPNAVQLV